MHTNHFFKNFNFNIFLKIKQITIGVAIPAVRGKATSTRSGQLE